MWALSWEVTAAVPNYTVLDGFAHSRKKTNYVKSNFAEKYFF